MSLSLSTPADTAARKDLIRLRMEMHRQQILYHAQPLSRPVHHIGSLLVNRKSSSGQGDSNGKGPLMVGATLILALLGPRLGKAGKMARLAITLYPLVHKLRRR